MQDLLSTNSDFEYAWLLDIGETQHMNFRKYFFWSFNERTLNSFFLVDDTVHTPQGKGCVEVYIPDIGEKLISNIWYVPTFKKNLLSLVTIRQAGHAISMRDGLVTIHSIKKIIKLS